MSHKVIKTGDYTLSVSVALVATLSRHPHLHPTQYHMAFRSKLKTARKPRSERTVFAITTDRTGLENLVREIYTTLELPESTP